MIFLIIVVIVFAAWLYQINFLERVQRFKKIVDFSKTIPGPPVLDLMFNAQKEKVLSWLMSNRIKYGKTFRIWFGKDLLVFFTDPEDVKIILSSQELLYKSGNYRIVTAWLGQGLLTSGGKEWQQQRKLLTPAFHFNILKQFKEPMEDCCQILINKLDKVADGRSVNIYSYITLYALDVICETAMGIKKNAQLDSESDYVKAVQTICTVLHRRSFSMLLRMPFFYKLSTLIKVQEKALKVLHGETSRVIEVRRKQLENINMNTAEALEASTTILGNKKRLAFLDMLIIAQKEGKNLTDLQIREEVDTFMFEGHDTTSSALSFAIYLLSLHPKEQELAYLEAKDCEGVEIESMKYLEAVIKETLRLYPSVPFFSRNVREPITVGKITIPPGASLSVLPVVIQRNPDIYEDPEKFKPDRYLGDHDYHPFAHVAFSAGPRNCIGQKFAMLEMKSTLAKLLRNFKFLPDENYKPILLAELIMKSANGVCVRIEKRNN